MSALLSWLHVSRLALVACALLLCMGLTASVAFADEAITGKSPDSTTCSPGTIIIPSPNTGVTGSSNLEAVNAVSANDVWAVGSYCLQCSTSNQVDHTLTMHWDGTGWNVVPSPNPGRFGGKLFSVDAISANDVWAVGVYKEAGVPNGIVTRALAMHWDGSTWSVTPTPDSGTYFNILFGVSAVSADDVWAAGSTGNNEQSGSAMTLHWDGARWNNIPAPSPATRTHLADITAVSANDVWAVGSTRPSLDTDSAGGSTPFIIHWNGASWQSVTSPQPPGFLTSVSAASANDIWAVGTGSTSMILHWDGVRWSSVPHPVASFYDVYARAYNDAWAVGDGTALRWDGTRWRELDIATNGDTLWGVTAVATNDAWLVGNRYIAAQLGSKTLTRRWNGTQCNVVPSPNITSTMNVLNDVAASSDNDVWAVGSYGINYGSRTLIERWDGSAWSIIPSPDAPGSYDSLLGVSAISPNNIWAVGNTSSGGLIERWNGSQWVIVPGPTITSSHYLMGVAALSDSDVWAIGTQGLSDSSRPLALHWNGAQWNVVLSPSAGAAAFPGSIDAVSANDVWAVGSYKLTSDGVERTLTMRWNGAQWNIIPSPNVGSDHNSLRSVSAVSSNDVWAVGYYGPDGGGRTLILRWDGSQWNVVPSANVGDSSFLMDVHALSANNVWAVGSYETSGVARTLVMQWEGSRWRIVPGPNASTGRNLLNAVVASSDRMTWAVGHYDADGRHHTLTERFAPSAFDDVPSGSTFYPYVRCLVERGIISGYADCTFRPNNDVTRGQLSKIVSNSAGFNEDPGPQIFEDVPPGSTFYEWVQRLASRGHIGGYPCGGVGEPCGVGNKPYFRPNNNATRAQISKIVSNARGYNDPPGTQIFEDVPPTHPFYEWIQRLAQHGAMGGYECGGAGEPCGAERRPYFRPNNNATRGQTSKIVSNTFFPECSP